MLSPGQIVVNPVVDSVDLLVVGLVLCVARKARLMFTRMGVFNLLMLTAVFKVVMKVIQLLLGGLSFRCGILLSRGHRGRYERQGRTSQSGCEKFCKHR